MLSHISVHIFLLAILHFQAPKVHWDLTTPRVLTMEFCEGGKIDNLQYIRERNIPVDEVSVNDLGP